MYELWQYWQRGIIGDKGILGTLKLPDNMKSYCFGSFFCYKKLTEEYYVIKIRNEIKGRR